MEIFKILNVYEASAESIQLDLGDASLELDIAFFSVTFVPQSLADVSNHTFTLFEKFLFSNSIEAILGLHITFNLIKQISEPLYGQPVTLVQCLQGNFPTLYDISRKLKDFCDSIYTCEMNLNLEIIQALEFLIAWRSSKVEALRKILKNKNVLLKNGAISEFQ